jgi:hypothetical protein
VLRLNDAKRDVDVAAAVSSHSRLIFRTKGSMRLMLNMKVFEGMKVERASDKSIRFTGVNSQQQQSEQANLLGVYLVVMVIFFN